MARALVAGFVAGGFLGFQVQGLGSNVSGRKLMALESPFLTRDLGLGTSDLRLVTRDNSFVTMC